MGKTSGGIRKTGGLGGDRSGNAKPDFVSNPESIANIQNTELRREVQQAISKYESRLGVRQQNVQLANMEGATGVHVTMDGKSAGIYLNKRYFKTATPQEVIALKKQAYKTRFLTKTAKPVQHTTVHELAHATWNKHLTKSSAVAARPEIERAYQQFKSDYRNKRIKGYGRYALANVNEFWAEATTKAVLGKADKYTKFVKATIKKYKL